ncbi:hypothetical protein BA81_14192 [Bacillus safensis FO-36b]|uniref:hypothetical protein n=1 Tax=Bacillus safensis TaxID=561879 RepID=UPI00045D211B|nr:hypothetical protein [Bacillus safensis]KDE26704.1 hypothetical protein BA81_14192 [Bacillus safensis FO-36b]MCM3050274.1 hypothetical protein [Bacillus safensis]MEB2270127.1 hypothetical protein [Bacillus safensis]MEC1048604.1 hypothetical protein [Bacillus safensis]
MRKEYKELQIIKHSLQHYITRPNATDKEITEEKRLLQKITCEVNELKNRYGITKGD